MARCTLKTIAEYTGLSIPTISQVLNNRTENYSSAATRERIFRAAKTLGYHPNFATKLLRRQRTNTTAILVSTPSSFTEERMLKLQHALIRRLEQKGYANYVGTFGDDVNRNLAMLSELEGRGVEHLIFLGTPFGHQKIFAAAEELGLSCIADTAFAPRYVNNGSHIGAEQIFRYLRSRVKDSFRLVGSAMPSQNMSRLDALRKVWPQYSEAELISRFLYPISEPNLFCPNVEQRLFETGYEAAKALLTKDPGLGAIVFTNDNMALGGGSYLMEPQNEALRKKVILCGYNNDRALDTFPLPIISAESDIETMADSLILHCTDAAPFACECLPKLHLREWDENAVSYPPWHDRVIPIERDAAGNVRNIAL